MALARPAAPGEFIEALNSGLQEFGFEGELATLMRKLQKGIRVFTIALSDVERKSLAAAAHPGGWRFFAMQGDELMVGDVVERQADRRASLSSVSTDPMLRTLLEQAETVGDRVAEIQKQNYELRILRIPGMLFEGIWLRARAQEAEDLVIPVLSPSPEWKLLDIYTETRFMEVARPLARHFLEFDDSVF